MEQASFTPSIKRKVKQSREEKAYRYDDLDSLDDENLGVVLSECPYRLLTLALKATAEPFKERILSLLTADRRLLVIKDLKALRFDDLG